MINRFVRDICEELNINAPEISYDISGFKTDTQMAYYDGNTIFIKNQKVNPDILFAIAHELRHAWQIKYNEEYYFENYKTRKELNVEDYNLQAAELDANAFASIIMVNWFQLQPLYQGMQENVINKIKERIKELEAE